MIEEIETLIALAKHKTMNKTATALHLTQSAVSKRIHALELLTQKELIIKNGRNVELTESAQKLILQSAPLITSLKEVIFSEDIQRIHNLSVGFSESILTSWGAKILGNFSKKFKGIQIEPHAHRSPVIIDKVSSGELNFAIIAGKEDSRPGLFFEKIGDEELVLVGDSKKRLFCVQTGSGTWKAIKDDVLKKKITIDETSEFFFPISNLAKHGFCQGLVPIGTALHTGFKVKDIRRTGIYRPIYAVGRKRAFQLDDVNELINHFKKSYEKL